MAKGLPTTAQDIRFNGEGTVFRAMNVQEAIEEALRRSAEKLREIDLISTPSGTHAITSDRLFEMDPEQSLFGFLTEDDRNV